MKSDPDSELFDLAQLADQIICATRLNDIAFLLDSDKTTRIGQLAQSFKALGKGYYIVGLGPYNCGIMKLTVDEVTIGRPPSPLERPANGIADFQVNDAVWLGPRETSRAHATIIRESLEDDGKFVLRDDLSTTGTFLNGQRLSDEPEPNELINPSPLRSGDVFSLGPTGINRFLFVRIFGDNV